MLGGICLAVSDCKKQRAKAVPKGPDPKVDLEKAYKQKVALIDRSNLSKEEKEDAKTAAEAEFLRAIEKIGQ